MTIRIDDGSVSVEIDDAVTWRAESRPMAAERWGTGPHPYPRSRQAAL
jgi:hypothetical protein